MDEEFEGFAGRVPASTSSLEVIDIRDIGASIASGRRRTCWMPVAPCSMDTLSAIAHGRSTNPRRRGRQT